MSINTETVSNILNIVLVIMLPVMAVIASKFVAAWSKTATAEKAVSEAEKEAYTRQVRDSLISKATQIVEDAVINTNQTFVESLKRQDRFTGDAIEEAMRRSLNSTKKLLNKELRSAICTEYGNVDAWLDIVIESFVNKHKNDWISTTTLIAEGINDEVKVAGGAGDE